MAELALSDAAGAEPTEAGGHSLPRVRLAGREAEAEEREPAPAEGGEEREAARSERQKRRDENIRAGRDEADRLMIQQLNETRDATLSDAHQPPVDVGSATASSLARGGGLLLGSSRGSPRGSPRGWLDRRSAAAPESSIDRLRD